jgi:hypothetical protein
VFDKKNETPRVLVQVTFRADGRKATTMTVQKKTHGNEVWYRAMVKIVKDMYKKKTAKEHAEQNK